jgi:hypothetical protein
VPITPGSTASCARRLRARQAVPKGAAGGRTLLRHFPSGGQIAMLVDQKQNDGIPVPFFGAPAMTAPGAGAPRPTLRLPHPADPARAPLRRPLPLRCAGVGDSEYRRRGSGRSGDHDPCQRGDRRIGCASVSRTVDMAAPPLASGGSATLFDQRLVPLRLIAECRGALIDRWHRRRSAI